ncbi:hypothetical protein Kfla_4588 [Kribbella flavida DSM 17836]|uniref:Uncharacterized protein n=1 Tax=Kribbella flavida (strain DSM 17836 / JCM 10339 / NBRC 14399) TaxID=479435 RepID=D2PY00_KRIFD|nr:hypothetical protein [Kribbella flavida]ADB33606.1 hypothetical protein Kfla_4588 [Kribbella flavida DSM 17836]
MIDARLHRWLSPLLGRRHPARRTPESFRPRGTSSRVSRLAARYDADVDEALRRLWPKARIYHDGEFARDRADFLLVVRGRGVMVETKVKSDPGVFRGSTLPPLLDRLARDGRRLLILLNQGDPTPARELVAAKLGDRARIVVWSGPEHDDELRAAVEELIRQESRHPL